MTKRLVLSIVLLSLVFFSVIALIIYCINDRTPGPPTVSLQKFIVADFSKMEDVKQSQQYKYLSCLYTDDQLQSRLPFSMSDFWVIQTNLLPAGVTVGNVPKSPTAYHTLFTNLDPHVASEKSVVYNYQYNSLPSVWGNSPPDSHFKLKNGLGDNSWVEVERGQDKTGGYTWFYYMPGTGNWFNLGKTIVFSDHHEAFRVAAEDGVVFQDPINGGDSDQLLLANYFIRKKYDTIQFTQRAENIFKYEIFNLKNKQTDSAAACIPGVKTRGNLECDCSSHLPYLNCTTDGPCGKIVLPNIPA
jgi:hypothetical protein